MRQPGPAVGVPGGEELVFREGDRVSDMLVKMGDPKLSRQSSDPAAVERRAALRAFCEATTELKKADVAGTS